MSNCLCEIKELLVELETSKNKEEIIEKLKMKIKLLEQNSDNLIFKFDRNYK
jgi:hypothetical protein